MVAGVRTFSIQETLAEPQALKPPPTRHALFVIAIALACLLHVATAGWGDLTMKLMANMPAPRARC